MRVLDSGQNVVQFGKGAADAYQNGLTLGNTFQMAGSGLGLAGDFADVLVVAKRIRRSGKTGARFAELADDDWDAAEAAYDLFRRNTDDIDAISTNTGMPRFQVERVKYHIMIKSDHVLWEGVGRLDADPLIVNSWNRMLSGDVTPNDLQLMKHEYLESRMEGMFGTTLEEAHRAVSRRHPSGL